MSEGIRNFIIIIKAIVIFLALGALVSFIFYTIKRRDIFGGYIGGLVVGFIGALIGGLLLDNIFVIVINFLSSEIGVNVIAGFIGAYAALYVMNRLSHDRERKKY